MAVTLWERLNRLFGGNTAAQVEDVGRQLAEMRSTTENLAAQNNYLNSLLAISFRQQGGFTRFDTVQQVNFIQNGYNISSAVYSIVSDIATKAAAIPLRVYEVENEAALKNYQISKQGTRTPETLYKTERLRKSALRDVGNDHPIQRLIDHPNPEDNATLFYETSVGFNLLCGNNYWYAPRLDKGADKGKITQLRIMPSQFTGIVLTQGFPARVLGYELIIDGVVLLTSDEVLHMRYPNYNWTVDGQQLYGLPPLRAAYNTLQRSNSAETSATSMFDNGGPAMLISNKSISPDDRAIEQMGRLKKQMNDEYSGNTNRNKIKLTAGDIQAIPLGLSPVDLNILESEKWSFDMLCNVFHVSSVMFNNHDGNTESNVKEMRKDSWTRAVLPQRKMHADSFNRQIVPAYNTGKVKYFVDMDISGIAELQPDMEAMTRWLAPAWWVTPNEKRKLQDFDESADPNMSKIWMPGGYTLMDDAVIDVDSLPDAPEDDSINDNNDEGDDNNADA